jgi:hypothetical protein
LCAQRLDFAAAPGAGGLEPSVRVLHDLHEGNGALEAASAGVGTVGVCGTAGVARAGTLVPVMTSCLATLQADGLNIENGLSRHRVEMHAHTRERAYIYTKCLVASSWFEHTQELTAWVPLK